MIPGFRIYKKRTGDRKRECRVMSGAKTKQSKERGLHDGPSVRRGPNGPLWKY